MLPDLPVKLQIVRKTSCDDTAQYVAYVSRVRLLGVMQMRAKLLVIILLAVASCQEKNETNEVRQVSDGATPLRSAKSTPKPREQVRFCESPDGGDGFRIDYASGQWLYSDIGGWIENCPAGGCVLAPMPLATFETLPSAGEDLSKNVGGYKFTMSKMTAPTEYKIRVRKTDRSPADERSLNHEYIFDKEKGIVRATTPLFKQLYRCKGRLNFQDIERLMRLQPTRDGWKADAIL